MLNHRRSGAMRAMQSQNNRGTVPVAFIAFPLFLSVDLDNVSLVLDDAVNVWKILSTVTIALLYVNRLVGRKPTSVHILPMATIMFMLLFSTIMNSGSLERYFVVWGGFFAVGVLVEVFVRERPLQLFLALKVVLSIIVTANFVTVLIWPEGLWTTGTEGYWLLGHRNNFGTPLVAAFVIGATYDLLALRRLTLSTLLVAASSFFSIALTWSASSIVAIVLAIGATLIIAFGKRGVIALRPVGLLTLYIALDVGIVLFGIQDRAKEFINDVLERSTDLTGRTRIWEIVFGMIRDSPIWGNGVQLTENNGLTIYNSNYVHAHNGELDILMQGGLMAFIPFVIMVILVTRKAAKYYNHRPIQVLFIGLIVILVHAITGLFFSSYAVLVVFLLLNAGTISDKALELSRNRRFRTNLNP